MITNNNSNNNNNIITHSSSSSSLSANVGIVSSKSSANTSTHFLPNSYTKNDINTDNMYMYKQCNNI